jgi:hypothetical protein
MACCNPVENLIESRLARLGDQPTAKVLLQGLVSPSSTLAQDPVSVFRDVFDLHTGHSAILAPLAPEWQAVTVRSRPLRAARRV